MIESAWWNQDATRELAGPQREWYHIQSSELISAIGYRTLSSGCGQISLVSESLCCWVMHNLHPLPLPHPTPTTTATLLTNLSSKTGLCWRKGLNSSHRKCHLVRISLHCSSCPFMSIYVKTKKFWFVQRSPSTYLFHRSPCHQFSNFIFPSLWSSSQITRLCLWESINTYPLPCIISDTQHKFHPGDFSSPLFWWCQQIMKIHIKSRPPTLLPDTELYPLCLWQKLQPVTLET